MPEHRYKWLVRVSTRPWRARGSFYRRDTIEVHAGSKRRAQLEAVARLGVDGLRCRRIVDCERLGEL